jgi:hypothetical protein
MSLVVPRHRLASAFVVFCGCYGAVSRYAQRRGVCRPWVYREAGWIAATLADTAAQAEPDRLRARMQELEQRQAVLEARLAVAVVLGADKQAEFSCTGQAHGVSLPVCWALLQVLLPGRSPAVATSGRRAQAAGPRAGRLPAVLGEWTRPAVREAAADEIHVKAPVFMAVEP